MVMRTHERERLEQPDQPSPRSRKGGVRCRPAVVIVSCLALSLTMLPSAEATIVPLDPGAVAAGRPLVWTTQNLPSLASTEPYDAGPGFAAQIENLYRSGRVRRLQRQIASAAARAIRQDIGTRCAMSGRGFPGAGGCRDLVVFDIDDTLLNNFELYAGNHPAFSYDDARQTRWVEQCRTPANHPVRRLFRRLQHDGVPVALVAGRPGDQRAATRRCLRLRGIDGWRFLILRDTRTADLPAARFKAMARAHIQGRGYRIVASIGDQVSDMSHGHLRRGFLLPNPMYYLP